MHSKPWCAMAIQKPPDRGFRRTIAAAAYHLAGFSAVAYSLFNETADDLNASPGEVAIEHLILRDLGQLARLRSRLAGRRGSW